MRTVGLVVLGCLLTLATNSRADGDGAHKRTLAQQGKGLDALAVGVGLGGRRAGTPAVPVTTAQLDIVKLPTGAKVEHAYLYWITYGPSGNASMTFDGTALTGTLIGTDADTCWPDFLNSKNFLYRVDVTAKVTGNAPHTVTGFPSGAGTDTQGASLFVVFSDPAGDYAGNVFLYDGAIVSASGAHQNHTTIFDAKPPKVTLAASFMVGVGDGQEGLGDGNVFTFNDKQLPSTFPGAGTPIYFNASAGTYWDTLAFDVKTQVIPTEKELKWQHLFSQDCVVFAYSALTFRAPLDELGADDGGTSTTSSSSSSSGSGSSSGATSSSGAASASPDAGTLGVGPIAADDGSDGCGCDTTPASRRAPLAVLLLAGASLAWRRRRG